MSAFGVSVALAAARLVAGTDAALRIVPPERATFAAGQHFDVRVEAENPGGEAAPPPAWPAGLRGRH